MSTFDRADLMFQLFDVAGVEGLIRRGNWDLDRTGVEAILDTAAQIAADHFAPHARLVDENEPEFVNGKVVMPAEVKTAVDAFVQAGFIASGFREDSGGMGLPEIVHQAAAFIFGTANISFGGYGLLTVGAGRLIESFGSARQKDTWLKPMVEGRFFGTMCLSEPQAGSSLSDITTRAEPLEDGLFRITGRKMWISGGEHELSENIVHLVLAKIPGGPPGVKGISLFIVPKRRADGTPNDVSLAGLNHKMGYRGITNCALNFGEKGACIGELVGEAHKGLGYMFQMMNEARIGVGLGATALAQAGYRASLDYALQRPQGRHPDVKDPASAPVMLVEHADIRRLLTAQKAAVEPALALGLFCAVLVDEVRFAMDEHERARHETLLGLLTPVAKSWPSEFCLEANKHAIQVLGGAGYTRDYPLERLYRDNRLNPIHEGTHGIQGLDLLARKVLGDGGKGLRVLTARIREDIAQALDLAQCNEFLAPLDDAFVAIESATMALGHAMAQHPRAALANATLYLDMVGHGVMGWMWLRLAIAAARREAQDGPSPFTRGKLQAARYFYARELVRVRGWAKTLTANDLSAFAMQPDWF
jgi:butyryl-CoA dehydrogenase